MTSSPRFTLSLVMGFTTLLSACGGGGGEGSVFGRSRATGTVSVILQAGETPMGREIVAGLQESATEHALKLAVTTSGGDPAREQAAVAKAIADKAAALVVESIDSVTAGASAAAAAKAGIPYFAIGVPAPRPAPMAAHVDVDHYAAGRVAAEYLAGYLGGKGILALVRAPGAHGTRDLEQGFRDGVAAHKGMSVIAVVDAADQPGAAAGTMQLLRAQRGVKGVFAAGPALAQGATEGAITGRRADLAIVSFEMSDLVRAAVANAQEAPIKASVIGRPRELGKAMMDEVALQLADEPVAAEVRVPVRLITADS
ncbi:MAG TPA: substrate-binding domain-containing protein, partial [Gemmatimonadaceae bacterium]